MTHVEALSPRELFAVAEIRDATFGDHGVVKLPDGLSLNGMTATHGAIYVDAFNSRKDRRLVYKYTDTGTLDTTWGNGGYIVPRVIVRSKGRALDHYTPLNITYDPRSKGLLLGFVNGDAIDVERRTAAGVADAAWGNNGIHEFRRAGIAFTLNHVTPLSGKRVVLAFTGQSMTSKTTGGVTRSTSETDIALVRLDRFARPDKTFSDDGFATVASGNVTGVRTAETDSTGSDVRNASVPTFGSFNFAPDGNYRLIATREQSAVNYHYDSTPDSSEFNTKSGRASFSAELINVSVDGNSVAAESLLLRRVTYDDVQSGADSYHPKLAIDDGEGGVLVLANLNYSATSVIRVRPGYRSASVPLQGSDPYVFELFRNANGQTFVKSTGGAGKPTVARYRADLVLDHGFGTNGVYTETNGYILHAGDDAGRLMVGYYGNGGELYRLL